MSRNTCRISRRTFLASALVSAALASVHRTGAAAAPERWVLLSDIHICHDRNRQERDTKPAETFAAARAQIVAMDPRPTGVLVTGDCVDPEGAAPDYAALKEEMKPLTDANIPVHLAMGNHDNRENLWATFADERRLAAPAGIAKHTYVVPGADVDWYVLDSTVPTSGDGEMGAAQLAWLGAELDKKPEKPAVLLAHHVPQRDSLLDVDAFWKVILPRKCVKAYIFGHSHRWAVEERDGLHLVNLPTLAWIFDETQPRAWMEATPRPDGMTLQLHCLNKAQPANGGACDLRWRA